MLYLPFNIERTKFLIIIMRKPIKSGTWRVQTHGTGVGSNTMLKDFHFYKPIVLTNM